MLGDLVIPISLICSVRIVSLAFTVKDTCEVVLSFDFLCLIKKSAKQVILELGAPNVSLSWSYYIYPYPVVLMCVQRVGVGGTLRCFFKNCCSCSYSLSLRLCCIPVQDATVCSILCTRKFRFVLFATASWVSGFSLSASSCPQLFSLT